jgi:hypothetical protein
MTWIILSIAVPAVGVAAFLLGWTYALRRLLTYRCDPDAVRVMVAGRVALFTIPYETIAEIRRLSTGEVNAPRAAVVFEAARAGNRWSGGAVLIVRKNKFRRGVIITPDDPEEFVARVSSRVAEAKGKKAAGSRS